MKSKDMVQSDHRYFPRLRISLDADLFRGGSFIGRAKTRDICFDGLYLETRDMTFNTNEVIGIRLRLSDTPPILKSVVTHASAQGIGVVMIDFSKEVYLNIYLLYKERDIPLRRSMVGTESQGKKWQRIVLNQNSVFRN